MKKQKYAIFKGNIGLYSMDYVDNLEDCLDYLGGHLIKEEDLPILFNDVGGHTSFYPISDNFVKIIEIDEDKEPLTREERYPKNSDEFEYGWISPNGDTYNTGYKGHLDASYYICKELGWNTYSSERRLEEAGWVKVTSSFWDKTEKYSVYVENRFVTKAQAETLERLGLDKVGYVPGYIEHSRDKW